MYEHRNGLSTMNLYTQSIPDKFDQSSISLSELHDKKLAFSQKSLRESCLRDKYDITPHILPGLHYISKGMCVANMVAWWFDF